ncbi:hypothetical protein [Pseudoalteromonas pernae]
MDKLAVELLTLDKSHRFNQLARFKVNDRYFDELLFDFHIAQGWV